MDERLLEFCEDTAWWFRQGYEMRSQGRTDFPHGAFRSYHEGDYEKQAAICAWSAGQKVWDIYTESVTE